MHVTGDYNGISDIHTKDQIIDFNSGKIGYQSFKNYDLYLTH